MFIQIFICLFKFSFFLQIFIFSSNFQFFLTFRFFVVLSFYLGKTGYPKWSALTRRQLEHARTVLRRGKVDFRDLVVRIILANRNRIKFPEERSKWQLDADEAAEIISKNYSFILS